MLLMRLERKVSDRSAGQEEGEGRERKHEVTGCQGYPGTHHCDSLTERRVRARKMVRPELELNLEEEKCCRQIFVIGLRYKNKTHTCISSWSRD